MKPAWPAQHATIEPRAGRRVPDRRRGLPMKRRFNTVVDRVIQVLGTPAALVVATLVIVVWAVTGPLFGFSDTWQLVINTSTTIVTFLMVFVIQNAQNRDAKAVHIKLDELITSIEGARNKVVFAEHQTEEEQDREIAELARQARKAQRAGAPAAAIVDTIEQAASAGQPRPGKKQSATQNR